MHKKELVMILVLGMLFSLSGVFAGHFVEINGTVYYRVANTSTLSGYENNGNVANGTIDLINNIGGFLSDSLLQNVSPVIHLFPVADTTTNLVGFTYNISDDSTVSNCSLYIDGVSYHNTTTENSTTTNNSISWTDKLSIGSYVAQISCTDEFGNIGLSNNVSFNVIAEEVEITPSSSGGGSRYSLSEAALESGINRNVGNNFVWRFNAGSENHTITFNSVERDNLVFTIASTPRVFSVKINESVLIDVEEDGDYDLNITYNKYYGRLANVGIKAVSVKYGDDGEVIDVVEEPIVDSGVESSYTDWIIGIIIVALIIGGLVWFNSRRKRK